MADAPTDFALVLTTTGTGEEALSIARALVDEGLAACVNVVPGVTSVYRWKGAVDRASEVLLLIKTRSERFEAVRQALVALHPYELPEIIALPIEAGHAPYLAWLDDGVR